MLQVMAHTKPVMEAIIQWLGGLFQVLQITIGRLIAVPTYTTAPQILSMVLSRGSNAQSQYTRIQGSDTGAFAGEETDYGVIYLASTNTVYTFG